MYTPYFHDVVVLVQNLDVTVTLYNQVRESILDVEYPLIESQLADIDKQLERAISQLNWTSDGMSPPRVSMAVETFHITSLSNTCIHLCVYVLNFRCVGVY